MTPGEEDMMRACIAMQVAVLEHASLDARTAIHAMIACKNTMAEAIATMKHEDRLIAAEHRLEARHS